MEYVRLIAWIVAAAYASIPPYWLGLHPFVGFWRAHRAWQLFLLPMGLGWLLLALFATRDLVQRSLYGAGFPLLLGALLFVAAMRLYRRVGHFGLATLIGLTEVVGESSEGALVTRGLHGRMRHPIYLAHLLHISAWTVGSGSVAAWVLLAVAIALGALMIFFEDRELERRFGAAYAEYRRRVPVFSLNWNPVEDVPASAPVAAPEQQTPVPLPDDPPPPDASHR